ncbi:MAG: acyltransferase [Nocardioides sp.]|nr:acyltransferase [Nocardioides sp.]
MASAQHAEHTSLEPTARPDPDPALRSRLDALDGLRGIALVLVILSHCWILWSFETIDDSSVWRPIFRSGNFAVTIFLVVTGYLTFRSLSAHGLVNMRIGVSLVRRVMRVAPLTLLVVPLVIVASVFSDDPTPRETNWQTLIHIWTYTWNWHVQTDAIESRWDLGHMWYLSVDMQAFVVMAVVLYFVRRRPAAQIAVLGGLLLLLTWWRMHVAEVEPVINVLLRTTARMDAFVVGLTIGVVLSVLPKHSIPAPWPSVTAAASALMLPPLLWFCSTDERFLHWGVTLLELDLALLVAAAVLGAKGLRVFVAGPLTFLGRHSLPIYIFHYPVFAAVESHTKDWGWQARTLVAAIVTVLVCMAAHYLVERHVARLLTRPFWARFTPRHDVSPEADPRTDELRADDLSLPVPEGPVQH